MQQNSQYDFSRPWQQLADSVADERTWEAASPPWYPPVIPRADPYAMIPPMYGYRSAELTVYDILDNIFSRLQGSAQMATESDDWSGVQGGYQATMRPTGVGGGGVS